MSAIMVSSCKGKTIEKVHEQQQLNFFDNWADTSLHLFLLKSSRTYGNNFCISLYLVKLATVAFEDLHRQLEVEQKKQTCCQIECNNNNICTKQIIKLPQKFKKFDLNETQDESQRLLQMANFLNFVMVSLKIVHPRPLSSFIFGFSNNFLQQIFVKNDLSCIPYRDSNSRGLPT